MRHTHTDILLVPLGVLAFAAALAGALLVGGTPVAGGVIASIVTGGFLLYAKTRLDRAGIPQANVRWALVVTSIEAVAVGASFVGLAILSRKIG